MDLIGLAESDGVGFSLKGPIDWGEETFNAWHNEGHSHGIALQQSVGSISIGRASF